MTPQDFTDNIQATPFLSRSEVVYSNYLIDVLVDGCNVNCLVAKLNTNEPAVESKFYLSSGLLHRLFFPFEVRDIQQKKIELIGWSLQSMQNAVLNAGGVCMRDLAIYRRHDSLYIINFSGGVSIVIDYSLIKIWKEKRSSKLWKES